MESIASWLARLGLERYAAAFAENDIDLDVMPSMTEQDLERLGVSMGHRKRILAAVRAMTGARAGAPALGAALVQTHAAEGAPEAGERRQLTVMFCDLVGSTALAERLDPEDLRLIIRAYQQCAASMIERFEGHVAQYLGDGLLVYFGHPHAHENDAERAVRAALGIVAEIQELVARHPFEADVQLAVRIGIHTGLIVIGEVGAGSRREQLALGDTPNIAARLQSLALPDQIVVSENTQRLIAGSFEFDGLGLQPIKGIREPMAVWAVSGVGRAQSRFEAATLADLSVFVGRAEESALIQEKWRLAIEGTGQVILLSGEAGIGKSRILAEARRRLDASAHTLQCQCSPFHVNDAFYPITQEFARVLEFSPRESAASRLSRLSALVEDKLRRPARDTALLASLLSIADDSPADAAGLPALRRKKQSIRALLDLVQGISERAPTLLLFEDAHWADPTSIEVLDELIERSAAMRLLIIITYRPEFDAPWQGAERVTARSLARLNHTESAALVAAVTGGKQLPAGLLDQIVGKADGVPLFVEELTKFLLESDRLFDTGGRYEYAASTSLTTIPATLRDSLMARLDRVTHVKEIAQIGAAIGREFSYEMMFAVAKMPKDALDEALNALTESGLAFQHRSAPDAAYTFKHGLVQETAYESMLKSRRQELHRAIIAVLQARYPALGESDPALFAHHASAAGLVELAVPYWRKAASISLRRMALAEAASQLGRGLELVCSLPPSPERDRRELPFHALLGTTYMLSRGWGAAEVERAYSRANELCKSVENQAETIWPLWGVAVFHMVRGEITRAAEIASRISNVATASDDRIAQLVAHMMRVQVDTYSGRFEDAQAQVSLGQGFYNEIEDRSLISLYSTDLMLTLKVHESHLLWLRGLPDQARALCDEKDELARSLDHPYSLSWALTWGAIPHLYRGDTARLLEKVDKGIRIAEEFGFAYTAAIGLMARGWGRAQLGELENGIEQMQAGLAAFKATGAAIVVPFFQTMQAELLGRADQKMAALALLDEAQAQVEAWGERWQESEIHRTRGLLLAGGVSPDIAAAERSLRSAVSVAADQHAPGWLLRATLALARLLSSQGRAQEGKTLLAAVLSSFKEGFETADVREARDFLRSVA